MELTTLISQVLPTRAPDAAAAVDEALMRRALDIAWLAAGHTYPNPMVGAVVADGGDVIAEGYHPRCGQAHGEVIALDRAGERARGKTLYVTLEPCAHHGRTPPCVDRVIQSGVSRVVMTTLDPDPRVYGRGVERLRAAGIRVEVGCMPAQAVLLNLGYYLDRLKLHPTVTLKMATTMDGKIAGAPGRRDDVTGEDSRRYVHRMRASHDCVVVGADTWRVDDPRLDVRGIATADGPGSPVPVVMDSRLRTPADNRWAREGRRFVVATTHGADEARAAAIERAGGVVLRCDGGDDGVDVRSALSALDAMGLRRVLVEGGAAVFTSFVRSGAWDSMYLFQSRKLFGERGVPLYRGEGRVGIEGRLIDTIAVGEDALHRFLSARVWNFLMPRLDRLGLDRLAADGEGDE